MILISACQKVNAVPPASTEDPNSPFAMATAISGTTGPQMLHKDFEQPGSKIGNVIRGEWTRKVVDGNGVMEVQGGSRGPGNLPVTIIGSDSWSNIVFGFRFKVTECTPDGSFGCVIIVTFRNETEGGYVLTINSDTGEVMLQYGDQNGWVFFDSDQGITDTLIDLPLQNWHEVLLVADHENISIGIDGVWTNSLMDDRLKTGSVHIEIGTGTTVQLDDFNAWNIPDNLP